MKLLYLQCLLYLQYLTTMLVKLTENEYGKISENAPLWQSLSWKAYQESIGRKTRIYGLKTSNLGISTYALVTIDKTTFGLSVWDIPRGPVGPDSSELISQIVDEAKKEKCMALYFSGETEALIDQANCCSPRPSPPRRTSGEVASRRSPTANARRKQKIKKSDRHEQPEETLVIDLKKSEEEILSQMKQKGRYNIRVAEKNNIQVDKSSDVDSFYDLLSKTSGRDGFKIKPKSHYEKFLGCVPGSFLLVAKRIADRGSRIAIAGLIGAIHNATGYYYYGASDYEHRNLMAPYLLQWEAMKYCKAQDCNKYDLLGIGSHWAGVTEFKMKFGGEVQSCGKERMIVIRPVSKWILETKRKILG